MKKTIITLLIVLGVLIFAFYSFAYLGFTGMFDKKYTREELIKNFIQYEDNFSNLATLFKANVPKDKEYVTLGLSTGNKFSLIIFPNVISPTNKIIGGNDLELNSIQLDSALTTLGWQNETVKIFIVKSEKESG